MSKYLNGNTPETNGRSAQVTQAQMLKIKSTFRDLGVMENEDQMVTTRQILDLPDTWERWPNLSKAAARHLLAVLWEINRDQIINRLKDRAKLREEMETWDA
jgi:hypothetical protein